MTLTLKKRLINVGVLSAVFIVAVIIFSYVTNKGNDNMTADMGAATFPQISFSYGDYKINTLTGYAKRMDVSSMHNTITPVADQSLDVNIEAYGNKFTGASYKVYTLDGTSELESKKIKKAGKNFSLDLSGDKVLDEERILEVRLNRNGADPVYFYTRIVSDEDANVAQCLNYISDYHENALAKAENAGVGAALEPTNDADNTTLQHVTINSNYEQVTWGSLKPQVEQEERWSIKELNSTCMSVLLQYRVSCKGEENESDRYAVEEFFRVRYIADAQKTYLLDYDRTMDQIFDATKKVLNEKGIILGIAPTNLSYKVNKDGTIVSFVEANELWNYNKDSDEVSLVFGFADAENTDVRNLVPDHKIKILKVDAKGNTTFLVSGYMNRGEHEGEVGVAVYYYDIEKNSVEEKVFISTNKSYAQAVSELGEMSYYDAKTDMLYTMVDGTLYQYSIEDDEKTVLVKGLDAQQYVVSEDGSLIAYQADGELGTATKVSILNVGTGKKQKITCSEGECIRPLGFIRSDFVYGIAKTEDIGNTVSGEATVPMYKLEIRNQKGKVIKTYQTDGIYILNAAFDEDMITLERASKDGDTYTATAPDYITNNEQKTKSNITLETYATDLKQTQVRLTYNDGISDKEPKVLKPKQILFETPQTITFSDKDAPEKYYVYGHGEIQGVYTKAGDAIKKANDYNGVVVDSSQDYVWERGNRNLQYSITEKDDVLNTIKDRLKNQEKPIDILKDINDGAAYDLTGCTTEEILYIINQGRPVIAMLDSQNAVILVGYSDTNVVYEDLNDSTRHSVKYEEMDQMTSGSGNAYIG
ncbi:hypothetical protein DW641_10990 [Dorea longicatena]|uniref:Peptidase C39-like domain-containing protein n=1 Tax=Dorea longicatena TaxID=88431 RepID=A0A414S0G4_9FIRM|nr:hypothetical protein [Dorea longicatena]RHG06678.1 hypothetical protein DW641_10990 [Dorea longicatena]